VANFRKLKVLALIFVFVVVFAASFTFMSSEPAQASRCDCWVMYCMLEPPYYCWDVCVPCPPLWP
jgi:hypothetical protein